MWQKILDIEHALDIVLRSLVHRYATVVVLHDTLKHLWEGSLHVEIHDVKTAGHHLTRHLTAKADDSVQHAALLRDILLVGEFHGFLQIIHRKTLVAGVHEMLGDHLALDKEPAQRAAKVAESAQYGSREACEAKGMLCAVDFGGNLSEEQQEEGEQDGHAQILEPFSVAEIHGGADGEVEQHHYGHIHQVVADEDGGQQLLGVTAHFHDACIVGGALFLQFIYFGRAKIEESCLAGRHECRA